MAEIKTKVNAGSVHEFLNAVPDEQKRSDSFAVMEIMQEITKEEPKMWGTAIVGFGKYHYKYDSGHEGDMCLIGFSPRKQNLTLYLYESYKKYDELMAELGKYKISKACLYIKKLSDVDVKVLKELISRSTKDFKKELGQK